MVSSSYVHIIPLLVFLASTEAVAPVAPEDTVAAAAQVDSDDDVFDPLTDPLLGARFQRKRSTAGAILPPPVCCTLPLFCLCCRLSLSLSLSLSMLKSLPFFMHGSLLDLRDRLKIGR
jgi:hypothetical protein